MINNLEFITGIISSLVAGVAALIASYIAARYSKERKKNLVELKQEARRKLVDSLLEEAAKGKESGAEQKTFKETIYKNINEDKRFVESIVVIPAWSKQDVQKEVEETVSSLKERLETIENRFPSADLVDKIASANDAILATKIEALTEAISRVEGQLITKWDVAKIVFQIIGALGGLIAISLTVLNFFLKSTSGG